MNLNENCNFNSIAAQWLDHAKNDFKMAKIASGQEGLIEQICFHAQQAVEKAMKAVLVFHQIDFPFTHDLEQLLVLLERKQIVLPGTLQEIGLLTPYAVETRYPGDWGDITDEDVQKALDLAEKALSWAENNIDRSR